MSLRVEMYRAIRRMPACVAGAYIDLNNSQLLCMLTMEDDSEHVLERFVGVAEDLFQGSNVLLIEDIFKSARGVMDDTSHYIQEMVIMNDDLVHVFIRCRRNNNHILAFLFQNRVNTISFLVNARSELIKLEAAAIADLQLKNISKLTTSA
ncbi:MAG: hypothetical protein KAJ95_04765 [Gammaproteobacteria bacterium]|nr:hypothetical protein [Gammaproteobacteria bacterium]